jgi:hypothetical protein
LQIGANATGFENAASFIEFGTASTASAAGVGIVDQQRVMEFVH